MVGLGSLGRAFDEADEGQWVVKDGTLKTESASARRSTLERGVQDSKPDAELELKSFGQLATAQMAIEPAGGHSRLWEAASFLELTRGRGAASGSPKTHRDHLLAFPTHRRGVGRLQSTEWFCPWIAL
ncbi:hypothetical protein MANI_017217 [Metarhizium anisopliae]|nr:hypothetical protein MANI_017217 [Metarhizium anisopliae]